MIDSDDKRFINEIAIGFADELSAILTDYSSFIERMYERQNEKLDEIIVSLDLLNESIDGFAAKE